MKRRQFKFVNLFIFLIYLLLVSFFFRDWLAQFGSLILGGPEGDGSLVIWIAYWPYIKCKSFLLGNNFAPFWNANIFAGFERAYSFSDIMPGLIPFVALLDLSFHSPILTINTIQFISIVLLPFGIFFLCREFRFGVIPAFLAGCIGSFSNFHIHNFLHFQLQFAFLIPYALFFLIRFLKKQTTGSLISFNLVWIFSVSVSSHIFLYISFSFFIVTLLFLIFHLKQNGLKKFIDYHKKFSWKLIIPILLISLGILFIILNPYIQNVKEFHWKRPRVESENFAIKPSDWRAIGLDLFSLLILILSFIYLVKKNIFNRKRILLYALLGLSILFYILSLGAKPYYPYTVLYYLFPGFSSIRDTSRILYLFWISFAILSAFIIRNISSGFHFLPGIISKKKLFYILLIGIEISLLFMKTPILNKFQIPQKLIEIHTAYSQGKYEEPLLLLTNGTQVRDNTQLDAQSQYLSIFHGKILVGGYSGFYPYSLHLLRYAMISFLSGESGWELEQIQKIFSASPARSIELLNETPLQKNKISLIEKIKLDSFYKCPTETSGTWRNLEKISPRYGMILGHTPNGNFCLNSYNKISDRKLIVLWKENEKIIYSDDLYITTPFYYHPKAPELLYGLDGYRKRGNYNLEIYEGEKKLYTGFVSVE